MKLSVIIPVYNEINTLDTILGKVIQTLPLVEKEIILVDDFSTDGTRQWLQNTFTNITNSAVTISLDSEQYLLTTTNGKYQLQQSNLSINHNNYEASQPLVSDLAFSTSNTQPQNELIDVAVSEPIVVTVKVIYHDRNLGKGAALRTGFQNATGDVFVVQDADLEYDPQDWGKMWRIIAEGWGDVVYGSRFSGEPHRVLYFHHLLGNKIISNWINLLCNTTLSDIEVCYKMFRKEVLDKINLTCDDFGFEVEFTVKVTTSRDRWRVYETGVSYYGRTYEEGKKINWQDGIKALWYIFKFRFFS